MKVCAHCFDRLGIGEIGETCHVCCGVFDRLDEFVEKIKNELSEYEYESFQVGSRFRGSIKALEELLAIRGVKDDFKKDFNSKLAQKLADATGKKIDSKNPDVIIIFDLEDFEYEITIMPIYIFGRYIKRVRNISQTRWICRKCNGKGCEVCNYTGRKYVTSVEELISKPVIEIFKADDAVLHGAGREDVDARMLGNGRPFVLEVINPRKRKIDLAEVEKTINEFCKGKVEVRNLKFATSRDVKRVKEERHVKVYRAKVVFDEEVKKEKLVEALKNLCGIIRQRTPRRVLHRRADKLRIRRLFDSKLLLHRGKVAVIEFEAEAGLYIKELVSGDEGRTDPSLSALLGVNSRVEKLDVIEVG